MRIFPEGTQSEISQIDRNAGVRNLDYRQLNTRLNPREGQENPVKSSSGLPAFRNWDPLTRKYISQFNSKQEAMSFNQELYGKYGNEGVKNVTKDQVMSVLDTVRKGATK